MKPSGLCASAGKWRLPRLGPATPFFYAAGWLALQQFRRARRGQQQQHRSPLGAARVQPGRAAAGQRGGQQLRRARRGEHPQRREQPLLCGAGTARVCGRAGSQRTAWQRQCLWACAATTAQEASLFSAQVQPGYAADWLANETGGTYIAFGAGSRLLKANSSDLYPAAPPAALPNASFALGFAYPVEGVAVGDQLVVSFASFIMNCSPSILTFMCLFFTSAA